ncbi:MAG: ribonuclease Z [Oscillospiraceae bacterium]|nr:ribonuclease Z [Oscillospiraceae bacterium]
MISFTLLGTAATMPLPDRALSSAFLRCGGGSILFDCGEGTQTAARKAHISLMKTDVIALSHYHGDHIFGLPGLLQTMNCLGRTKRLFITGPGDIKTELSPLMQLAGELGFDIAFVSGELSLNELGLNFPVGCTLSPFPTAHRVPSCGYVFSLPRPPEFLPERARSLNIPQWLWGKLQNGESVSVDGVTIRPEAVCGEPRRGLRVVFSGDTAPCEALVNAAAGADLLVCDATYAEDEQAPLAERYGHCTFTQAAETARAAGARRLWLTHYSQTVGDPETQLERLRLIFPDTLCGYDNLFTVISF